MKDELRMYCRLEGLNEEYLRARTKDDAKLERLKKKRARKSGRENVSLKSEEPDEA